MYVLGGRARVVQRERAHLSCVLFAHIRHWTLRARAWFLPAREISALSAATAPPNRMGPTFLCCLGPLVY